MRIFASRSARRRAVAGVALLLVAFVAVSYLVRQYFPFIFDAEQLRDWLDQFGLFAPLALILVQATQVIVAPVPGQVIALVSGYAFGPVAGTVYSLAGVLLGSAVAFTLAKRFGRPLVEWLLHEDVVAQFDEFVDQVGIPGLFVFVIIPGLPDDAICFLSGLTKWRLRTFLLVIVVGRLPAYVLTVYAGGELAAGETRPALALLGVLAAVSALGYYQRERIRSVIGSLGW
jgi:uncharacterized membrane protein YdjX (TVP38/TMEM64 family)